MTYHSNVMRYKLKDPIELERAADYLSKLAGREATVDIKRVNPNRTLQQNKYLHVLISYFGLQTGYTSAEAKIMYKKINKDLYVYKKNGGVFLRSSADLNTEEMTKSIDRFRQYGAEQGIDLPSADDKTFLEWAQQQIENTRAYL